MDAWSMSGVTEARGIQHAVTDAWSMSRVTKAYNMPPTNMFHLPGCWKMGQRAWSNAPLKLYSRVMACSQKPDVNVVLVEKAMHVLTDGVGQTDGVH